MLSATTLSVTMSPDPLTRLHRFGMLLTLTAGETLFRQNAAANEMYVIIQGDINLFTAGQEQPMAWLGPGDIVGEIGFILRTPRLATARAGAGGCTLWHLDRRIMSPRMDAETAEILTRLFIAMAPHIRTRLAKVTGATGHPSPPLAEHCDHEHRSIQQIAEILIGYDSWETAQNIWEFVRFLPFRFGFSNLTASRVLQQGHGMSTTKANLQVALLRACELDAAFGEVDLPLELIKPLIPGGYLHLLTVENQLKHYIALTRIGDEWYPCDATYPPQLWKRFFPQHSPPLFEPGSPCNPCNQLTGRGASDYRRFHTLTPILNRCPRYDAHNVEAMNISLDKVQGPFLMIPEWVVPLHYLMPHAPHAAYQQAYAGIVSEMERLYQAIQAAG